MRAGGYELRRCNDWCYQLYRVMPDGYQTKAKVRRAEDGRALMPMECYPTTIAGALRKMHELNVRDGIDDADLAGAVAAAEESERRVSELAERIEGAVACGD